MSRAEWYTQLARLYGGKALTHVTRPPAIDTDGELNAWHSDAAYLYAREAGHYGHVALRLARATGRDGAPRWVCDLDRRTSDPERAAIFVAEFLVWWIEEGRDLNTDDPLGGSEQLRGLAADAVDVLGGWRAARRTLASAGVMAPTEPPA